MSLFRRRRPVSRPAAATDVALAHPAALLARRVLAGELGMTSAMATARREGEQNGPGAATLTSAFAKDLSHAGRFQDALIVARLLLEQCDGARAGLDELDYANIAMWVFADYVEVTRAVLHDHASVLLYESAIRYGEEAARLAHEHDRPDLEGMCLHRLGALHLDTYGLFSGTTEQYWQWRSDWLRKAELSDDFEAAFAAAGRVDLADDGTLRYSSPEREMPSAERAFELSADYFARAAELRPDKWRGYSYKGLAQTYYYQRVLELAPVPASALDQACRSALRFLPEHAAEDRLFIRAVLDAVDSEMPVTEPVEEIRALLTGGLAAIVRRYGEIKAWDTLRHAVHFTWKQDPPTALRLLMLQRTLPGAWADEARRAQHLGWQFTLLTMVHSPAWLTELPDAESDSGLSRVRADESLTPTQRGYSYLYLARLAAAADRESMALTLTEQAFPLLHPMPPEQVEALGYFYAMLYVGKAVNAINAGRPTDSAEYYCTAMQYLLDLHCGDAALGLLGRIESIVLDLDENPGLLVASLAEVAIGLEMAAGDAATRRLQEIYRHVAALMFWFGTSAPAVLMLVQVAKGARRSRIMRQGLPPMVVEPPDPAWLAQEPRELLQRTWNDRDADRDIRLLAYAGGREQRPTDTPQEQAASRRARFSTEVWRALLSAPGDDLDVLILPGELQAALDPETILLVHWPAMSVDLNQVIVTLLVTNESTQMVVRGNEIPSGTFTIRDAGHFSVYPFEAQFIGQLRERLQLDPRPLRLRQDCVVPIANMREDLFQPLLASLDKLVAAGKNHVLIAPYGPYRFFPLHLAGPYDQPICADFTVTYLSDLGGLARPRRPRTRKVRLAAFGLTYDDRDDLPSLEHTAEEVRGVAEPFGATARLDATATKRAVLQALETAQMVHLRAHGQHDIDAPMLQTVYLAPTRADSGRLFAYEVLGLDLSGLELVTLSACETGLGRFDEGDNVAGLAANLLLGGCHRVVSTLWPAAERAAAVFFPVLYAELSRNTPARQAFAHAQLQTRRLYPEYRDWGTFIMYES
jgi:hypothetical protein